MKPQKINACYCQTSELERWEREGLNASSEGILRIFTEFIWMKAKFFIDDETTAQRKRRELWKAIKKNEVKTFIVPSMGHLLHRKSRCPRDVMNLIKFFDKHNVTFISLKESLHSATPLGRFNMLLFHTSVERDQREQVIPCVKNRMGDNKDLFPPPPGWNLN